MSDEPATKRLDAEHLDDRIDVESIVEGTSFEGEFDEDQPLGAALGGMIGTVVGRKIGAAVGGTIADALVDDLLTSGGEGDRESASDRTDRSGEDATDESEGSAEVDDAAADATDSDDAGGDEADAES